jgi:NADPH2:quinone reductase
VIDSVGGPLFSQLVGLLNYGGRMSVVGRSGGPVPEFNTATLLFRRIRIGGVSVGDYSAEQAKAIWEEIVGRLDAIGRRPQIDSTVPFEKVKEGFTRLAQGPMGKVLVQVSKAKL